MGTSFRQQAGFIERQPWLRRRRPSTQRKHPDRELHFRVRPPLGELLTADGPYGVNVTLGHDGKLLTSIPWSGALSGSTARTYDSLLRLSSESINGDATTKTTFGYDNDGLLTCAELAATSNPNDAGPFVATYSPDNGLLQTTRIGGASGATDTYTYNASGEPASHGAKFGSSALFGETLDTSAAPRDGLGRVVQRTEFIGGVTTVTRHGYDNRRRLTTVTKNGGRSYGYDANGNRTRATAGSVTTTSAYDNQDRLLASGPVGYAYGRGGELQSKTETAGTTRYQYDALGNLLHVDLPNGNRSTMSWTPWGVASARRSMAPWSHSGCTRTGCGRLRS
jgi:YD repeat-containing protein